MIIKRYLRVRMDGTVEHSNDYRKGFKLIPKKVKQTVKFVLENKI